MVKSGSSIRYTAESVGVKRSTLWSYIKKERNSPKNQHIMYRPNYACRRVFTDEEEVSIVEYAVTCSQMNFGLSRLDIRKLAYDVTVKNIKTVPRNWKSSGMAGVD